DDVPVLEVRVVAPDLLVARSAIASRADPEAVRRRPWSERCDVLSDPALPDDRVATRHCKRRPFGDGRRLQISSRRPRARGAGPIRDLELVARGARDGVPPDDRNARLVSGGTS